MNKKSKKKKILITGNFNILHPGHIRLFIAAKKIGDHLTIGLISDELAGNAAYINQEYRIEPIQNSSLVDKVELIDTSVEDFIKKIKPDIVLKGKEHENGINIEKELLDTYGGKLIFGSGDTIFSSSDLLLNELKNQEKLNTNLESDYKNRHSINSQRLQELIHSFKDCKVAVIGDLIIDQYVSCQALGMSQEDPTICVKPLDTMSFIGGAGIVASHAASLGAKVHFISVAGNDDLKDYALTELKKNKVNTKIFPRYLKTNYSKEKI